jgi:hypothetical protein
MTLPDRVWIRYRTTETQPGLVPSLWELKEYLQRKPEWYSVKNWCIVIKTHKGDAKCSPEQESD